MDDEVGPVAGAELVDLVEELVGRIAGEDIGEARLDPDAEQREPARGLPLPDRASCRSPSLTPGSSCGRSGCGVDSDIAMSR
ncbi:hypothetical protein ON003_14845 [Janibacter hoylei]|nr:hypothetical protein [Janibacter hoylei]MCW4602732.1 hypothetical protein [Janibacter hoylei]